MVHAQGCARAPTCLRNRAIASLAGRGSLRRGLLRYRARHPEHQRCAPLMPSRTVFDRCRLTSMGLSADRREAARRAPRRVTAPGGTPAGAGYQVPVPAPRGSHASPPDAPPAYPPLVPRLRLQRLDLGVGAIPVASGTLLHIFELPLQTRARCSFALDLQQRALLSGLQARFGQFRAGPLPLALGREIGVRPRFGRIAIIGLMVMK
ncbi:hypothetical protein FHX56_007492 [Paraburkholderia tropica]|nr:hypothetical protein [Paraburkholderia tropica]